MRVAFHACSIALVALSIGLSYALGQEQQPSTLQIGFIGRRPEPPPNMLPLDEAAPDEGLAGAELAIADDNGTGRFTGQSFVLHPVLLQPNQSAAQEVAALPRELTFIVADLPAGDLLDVARENRGVTFFNAGGTDDVLRQQSCLANVLHTIPSRAMLADALSQYLASMKWLRWFLVVGPAPEDKLYAAAIKRAAAKFGASVVAEKPWTFQTSNAHADTGHVTLQTEIPAFTRGVGDYDVLVVADELGSFGEELIDRTTLPRPVAGTQGLVATGWSAVNVEWGALQLQNRFQHKFSRHMTSRDYAAWAAVRSLGEAATRSRSIDGPTVLSYLRGPDFLLSGFKGEGQSFRAWDGQMRQPILLVGPRSLVSVSPQPGFLHQRSALDTLGVDAGETRCKR